MTISPERMTSQSERLLPRVIVFRRDAPWTISPVMITEMFNVTKDAEALT